MTDFMIILCLHLRRLHGHAGHRAAACSPPRAQPNPNQCDHVLGRDASSGGSRACGDLPGGTNQKNVRYGFGLGGVCEAAAVRACNGLAVGAARRGRRCAPHVVVLQQLCGQRCALRRRCAPHVLGSVLQYMTDFMIILCLDEKSHRRPAVRGVFTPRLSNCLAGLETTLN